MDYYNLGLTTGKAWRLGHMGEPVWEAGISARQDLHIMEHTHEASSFYRGFNAGVAAVDENAQQLSPPSPTSRDGLTFEERIEVLEKIAQRYHNLGNDMSFESYTTRLVLEEDVNAYFSSTPAEKQD